MMEISSTDHMKNEEVLHSVKKERKFLFTMKWKKANWIGRFLRRNCFLKHIIEEKTEGRLDVAGRWGRRSKQLLDDLQETRGEWKLKQGALDSISWRLALEEVMDLS